MYKPKAEWQSNEHCIFVYNYRIAQGEFRRKEEGGSVGAIKT